LYAGQSFGVADTGDEIIEHILRKMKIAAEYAWFYFADNNQSNDDFYQKAKKINFYKIILIFKCQTNIL